MNISIGSRDKIDQNVNQKQNANSFILKKDQVDDIILNKDKAILYNNTNESDKLKRMDENLQRIQNILKKNNSLNE